MSEMKQQEIEVQFQTTLTKPTRLEEVALDLCLRES